MRQLTRCPSIVTHILRQILPSVSEIDRSNFDILRSLDVPLLLAVVAEDDTASAETFRSAAPSLEDFILGISHDLELAGTAHLNPPGIARFNTFDEAIRHLRNISVKLPS